LNYFQEQLEKRRQKGNLRQLKSHSKEIDFFSNDYIHFAKKVTHISAPHGSTGSRLLSGSSSNALQLENEIADFHKSEAALLFNSGYTANLGLLSCICSRHDTLLLDKYAHASLLDGAGMSGAKVLKYEHNDLDDLRKKATKGTGRLFIVTESVFSMDGTQPNVEELDKICLELNAQLILDCAHGVNEYFKPAMYNGLKSLVARIMTYGKALGAHGAAVLCSEELKEFLVNFSRPFIYTTALSPFTVELIRSRYDSVGSRQGEKERLDQNVAYFIRNKSQEKNWIKSESHIQSYLVSGNERVTGLSEFLRKNGISCAPIKSPTVPKGRERIRFCLHSFNINEEMNHLFELIEKWENK